VSDSGLISIHDLADRRRGSFLLETEGLLVVEAAGISTPGHLFVKNSEEARSADLDLLPGSRVVVKVVAEGLAHKSELGGVAFVDKDRDAISDAIEAMAQRLTDYQPSGYLIAEFVEHGQLLGDEILLSVRWTDDFGPVVTLAPGGTQAEFLSRHVEGGRATSILSPTLGEDRQLDQQLAAKAWLSLATEPHRDRQPATSRRELAEVIRRLFTFAEHSLPHEIAEIEINPLVFRDGTAIALDALVRVGSPAPSVAPPRPVAKLQSLLRPRSMAIMGVSKRMNPGRIVLENVLASGFAAEHIHIVKPGCESLAGCACVPDLKSLPAGIDLAVLCIGASELPAAIEEILSNEAAETLILIAGGLGERSGSEAHSQAVSDAVQSTRDSPWGGPLVNGGNCLGVRSVPGRYDTLFIPRHKLSYPSGPAAPLALISQSGALAVAKASCLAELNPRYLMSLGNQIDLTVSDYLSYLSDDAEVRVFACYLEGFRPLDGRRWLEATARITQSGRTVILYRAGRTAAGSLAASSHTASIAGDYAVTRELAAAAGALIAETLEDFEDLVRVACALDSRQLAGRRLGALSNAGFECVAIADAVDELELVQLTQGTRLKLEELLAAHHLSTIVGVGNPLDVTPILGDAAFADAFRLVIDDAEVDVGLVGCVPLTGALQTLPAGDSSPEDVEAAQSVARRLGRLWNATSKPWVAVVDGGPPYDALVGCLAEQGIPVFRSVDRAVRLLETYAAWRLRSRPQCAAIPD